jgi:tetratricopeptide (TPR) repeat protein
MFRERTLDTNRRQTTLRHSADLASKADEGGCADLISGAIATFDVASFAPGIEVTSPLRLEPGRLEPDLLESGRPDDPAESASSSELTEALRTEGARLVELGRFEEALQVLQRAREAAIASDDQHQIDRATINVAAVAIELGSGGPAELDETCLADLRDVLGRLHSPENGLSAVYTLGRLFERRKDFKKALFYAQQARDRARWVRQDDLAMQVKVHNLLGNVLLGDSRVAEAEVEFRAALDQSMGQSEVWCAQVLDNLGYCAVIRGRLGEGITLLYRSLRSIRRAGAERIALSPLIDLAFALLEADRPRLALRHASEAFLIAQKCGEADEEKNSLILLGEAFVALDDMPAAHAAFRRLQERHFPDQVDLPMSLLSLDVRPLLSLRS